MKKGFTLAEILIVLVIIGVLTVILLPMAFQGSPDEEVMKFKKGNNTLLTVVRELVSSDEYYKDGDLGVRKNGQKIDGTHDGDKKYFCNTFADLLNVKSVNCSEYTDGYYGHACTDWGEEMPVHIDEFCLKVADKNGKNIEEIITNDGIVYYQASPGTTYNYKGNLYDESTGSVSDGEIGKEYPEGAFCGLDEDGFLRCAKVFCMDIDGIKEGIEPFGYAIRVDGKIYMGKRALEWMNKSIQKND